jgi:soluble lytic murein transglycosylase-like protein
MMAVALIVASTGACSAPPRADGTAGSSGRPATADSTSIHRAASSSPAKQSPDSPTTPVSGNDPAVYARMVTARARQAGVHPQLLMAILFNESDKPHDPQLERAWLRIKPDAALGIADMHQATFDEAKQGRDFAIRDWTELPDDPDLAIEAAAWYLHDLAAQLPTRRTRAYSVDELLALGYNAGPSNMRAFARGAALGPLARTYLQKLHDNWAPAGAVLRSPS